VSTFDAGRGNSSPQPELTRVGWLADTELSYEDWLRQGSRLGLAGRNAAWWVGDWVRYGTARYGSKYTAAARTTGYDRQTLMNMVYVATRYEVSRRRENLSWSHHAELAALHVEDQERWLDRASADRLTVRDLRELRVSIKSSAGGHGARGAATVGSEPRDTALTEVPNSSVSQSPQVEPSDHAARDRQVVCPECSHRFTVGVLGLSGNVREIPSG
jgi:hypothetical protein